MRVGTSLLDAVAEADATLDALDLEVGVEDVETTLTDAVSVRVSQRSVTKPPAVVVSMLSQITWA
jgi:hypothetical protein